MTELEYIRAIIQQEQDKQNEAKQEAAGAAFRAEISKNARARRAEKEAAEEAQRREGERKAAEAKRRQMKADQEKRYCLYWYLYAGLTILPLLIAALLIAVHEFGWLPIWAMAPIGTALCAFSVFNFVDLAHWIDQKAVKKFTRLYRRKFRAYLFTPYSELIRR